jgi:hypothetical protein
MYGTRWRWIVAPFFGFVALLLLAVPARAEGVVGNGTPQSCTNSALQNALTGGGLVTFSCGPTTVTIAITTKVIEGGATTIVDGRGRVVLDTNGAMQHFLVLDEGDLSLRHLTLQNGIDDTGGAIFVAQKGTVRLESVILRNNEANGSDSDGGAVHNRGTLIVAGSQFLNNHADDGGGAINNNGGTVSIRASIFSGNSGFNGGALNNAVGHMTVTTSLLLSNTVDNIGGGLFAPSGFVTMTNVTIAHNGAFRGGGIYSLASGRVSVLNSTIYTNTASSAAGGIWNNTGGEDANVTLKNTIVAGNDDPNAGVLNCDGPAMRTLGYNLIGDGTCIDATTGDLKNTAPLLGPLAENGSTIRSFLPLDGSPAIDGGDNTGCPRFDQRGYPRPIGEDCDIGSVEAGYALWLPSMLKEE